MDDYMAQGASRLKKKHKKDKKKDHKKVYSVSLFACGVLSFRLEPLLAILLVTIGPSLSAFTPHAATGSVLRAGARYGALTCLRYRVPIYVHVCAGKEEEKIREAHAPQTDTRQWQ